MSGGASEKRLCLVARLRRSGAGHVEAIPRKWSHRLACAGVEALC